MVALTHQIQLSGHDRSSHDLTNQIRAPIQTTKHLQDEAKQEKRKGRMAPVQKPQTAMVNHEI